MSLAIVVLAAGQGTRMKSDLAKVLHRLDGETLLGRVLRTAASLGGTGTAVVVGYQHERVRKEHAAFPVRFVLQEPQRGTGHAVQQAEEFLRERGGTTLVLYGDVPLLRRSTLLELLEEHEDRRNAVTVLTARVADPSGYGRILRDASGAMTAIVEDKDLPGEARSIDEINSGIYAFRTADLLSVLHDLSDDNRQRELYLTDTITGLGRRGQRVGTYTLADPLEISGINTPAQLAEAEEILLRRRITHTEDCPTCSLVATLEGTWGYPVLAVSGHAFVTVSGLPYNSGQVAVHPRRHVLRHSSLDAEERSGLWRLGQMASRLIQEVYHPAGMNIGYTAGTPGEHLAMQLVPRWVGDRNFLPLFAGRNLLPEMPEQTHARLARAMAERGIRP